MLRSINTAGLIVVRSISLLIPGSAVRTMQAWRSFKERKARSAADAVRQAEEAFYTWLDQHPSSYIGYSRDGRILVERWLEAYDQFLRTHRNVDGKEFRWWLVSLLYDLSREDRLCPPSATPRGYQSPSREKKPRARLYRIK